MDAAATACASAASAAALACVAGAPPAPQSEAISPQTVLEWCFVIGSLDLAVFGFLYSTYAAAIFADPVPPPIVSVLRNFCRLLAFVLVVLTGLAAYTAYNMAFQTPVWIIVGCMGFVVMFSVMLTYEMD